MVLSALLNTAIVIITAVCMVICFRKAPALILLRYFTILSNLLCAFSALAVLFFCLHGAIPEWALALKHAGTVSVTVTLLTVFLFLAPSNQNLKGLLTGTELYLHLICPVLAIASYCFENADTPLYFIPLGTVPVILYGALYLWNVILVPEEKRWDDFYGFNRKKKLPLVFSVMVLATFLISFLLRII